MRHNRILIIGSSGAGKSTFAKQLAMRTKLPLIHLDQLYWQPGWQKTERDVFREKLLNKLQKECWIIDGNFDSTLELRAQYADLVIFLNYPTWISFSRAIKRTIIHRGKTRPDMANGCPEKIDWEFAKWIWRYNVDVKPNIIKFLATLPIETMIINHPNQLKKILQNIK